ncbi:putative epidermal cell surface receptor isoform X2 [Thrips palmi]|uniref:Epidermal cell surface receptor isoform X2 n=1 Tax=Thrips palmi TaxID=161013 RepID=A0A6P8ZWU2_THRPL|nr:putative epidermal cell surface receptor isoform X2 [Thrips palmi]
MAPSSALVVLLVASLWIHSAPAQQTQPPQPLAADNKDVTTTTTPGPPSSTSAASGTETGRGRAINFTTMGEDAGNSSLADVDGNGHPEATTLRAKTSKTPSASGAGSGERRLDDVSMDDDDNLDPSSGMGLHGNGSTTTTSSPSSTAAPASSTASSTAALSEVAPSTTLPTCTDTDGKVYVEGQRFSKACDEVCTCAGGVITCTARCKAPFLRRGARLDPMCVEKDSDKDPCCVLLVCAQDSEPEPLESCTFKNKTYSRGQTFYDACESSCSCGDAGNVTCKPRCPPTEAKMSDRCLAVPDRADPCCSVVLCDVSLGDHDVGKPAMGGEEAALAMRLVLSGAEAINSTAVRLSLPSEDVPENVTVEASLDGRLWRAQTVFHDAAAAPLLSGLQPGRTYFIRLRVGADMGSAVEVTLPPGLPAPSSTPAPANATSSTTAVPAAVPAAAAGQCTYKGKSYALDEEFHDGCQAFCACTATGMQCAPLECPTDFGLDLLDPECLDWETVPRNFVPNPPHCCPEKVSCRNNGSCVYADQRFPNFSEIPTKVTGCDQRCFCEYGNVTCEAVCPPVSPAPPAGLPCPPHQAILDHQHGDDCCLFWMCPQPVPHFGSHPGFPDGFLPPGFPQHPGAARQDEVTVHTLEAVDDSAVRLVFSVPSVLVGLHGRVELRYTSDIHNDEPATWEQQVLAPPRDLIATPQLEFELGGLQPDTVYKIKITVILKDLHNTPSSQVLQVRTLPRSTPTTTQPPQIRVDAELAVAEVNATWARLSWRKAKPLEINYIDGVQLRYKEIDGKVYAATPLIHRAVTSYTLEGLRPDTQYEVGIYFIPFTGQTTELLSERTVTFTTGIENDPYKFELTLDVHHIKSTSVELSWQGVPYPEDKFVNIFRAIYQSDAGKEDFSSFKIAKRDSPPKTMIQDLKPGTRYRLWLEAYLTNGRIKKSNVQDFSTKPGSAPTAAGSTQQGKLEGTPLAEVSDYYGPLVAVAIIATLAILTSLALTLLLLKKCAQSKAAISTCRKSQSAYDNPSYKVEIQQETMDL